MYKILFYNFNPQSVNNAHLGFKDLGYEILDCACKDINTSYISTEENLSNLIDSFKPDIIFSYGWWINRLNIDAFCDTIKKKGIFHVFWAYDDPECFDNISLPVSKECDLVFTSVLECIEKYKEHGINAHLLPHGCDPHNHKKVAPVDKFKHDIVLLANNYNVKWNRDYFSYRLHGIHNLVHPLVENDYDLMTWGLWWDEPDRIYNLPKKNYSSFIPYGSEAQIYSSSKIALGLQSVGDSISHFSVRTFEILACSTFHLCQYSPALEYYFKKGVHMEWSQCAEETLEIVDFYLKNDNLREKIALKGQEEVYKKHTLKHRAQSAMDIIKNYIKK